MDIYCEHKVETVISSHALKSSAVTLKTEPQSPKVGMSKILSMVTIYPHLQAIGEISLERSWT